MPEPAQLIVLGSLTEKTQIPLTSDMERDLDARLASVEGHVRSVRRMLAEQRSCDSVLVQMAAIKAAMNQIIIQLLESHVETCATEYLTTKGRAEALAGLKRGLSVVLKST